VRFERVGEIVCRQTFNGRIRNFSVFEGHESSGELDKKMKIKFGWFEKNEKCNARSLKLPKEMITQI
jgi:hypothetical protein